MMNEHVHKTKPELWKRIESLEQKLMFIERYLDEKGLLEEATEYVESAIQDMEELPFD